MRTPRWTAPFLASSLALALASGLTLGTPRSNAQDGGSAFSAPERAALDSGRLVAHRRIERRGNYVYFGGTSYQTVSRSVDEVWRAAREPGRYRDLLPQVDSVRVISSQPGEAVVRIEHAYAILRAAYHLRIRFSPAQHDVSFELDSRLPNDVHSAHGFLNLSRWGGRLPEPATTLTDHGTGRTLVSWGILAAVDDGLVGGLVRPQLHDWMLRVPSTIRSFLEGRGRTLFRSGS